MKFIAFFGAVTVFIIAGGIVLGRCGDLGGGERVAEPEERPADAQLSARLALAYAALRDAAGTRRAPEAHRYARVAIDAIAGPSGRHGRSIAPGVGILPEDREQIVAVAGLALRAYDAAPPDSPLREVVAERVLGAAEAWRAPRARYDAIDRAVAAYRPDDDTIATLPGDCERALAWALLTLQAGDINDAHDLAKRGADAARKALDAVRVARASAR